MRTGAIGYIIGYTEVRMTEQAWQRFPLIAVHWLMWKMGKALYPPRRTKRPGRTMSSTVRRAVGACLLALPFTGVFTFVAVAVGLIWAIVTLTVAAAFIGAVVLGVELLLEGNGHE